MHIPRIFPGVCLGLALASVGCGGDDSPSNDNGGGGDGPCTITLSGELTEEISCTVAVLYDSAEDITAFGLTTQTSEPSVGADVRISGPATTGTMTDADCGECVIFAYASAGGDPPFAWAMRLTPMMQGSFSVRIDDLGPASSANGVDAYADPHGSTTAVLEAMEETGAMGTVNLSATF